MIHAQREISHLAIDIGGTLVKLVYFSLQEIDLLGSSTLPTIKQLELAGRLHFVKFESNKIDDCINFIENKGLHQPGIVVHATGGGAYKFAELFEKRYIFNDRIRHRSSSSIVVLLSEGDT